MLVATVGKSKGAWFQDLTPATVSLGSPGKLITEGTLASPSARGVNGPSPVVLPIQKLSINGLPCSCHMCPGVGDLGEITEGKQK